MLKSQIIEMLQASIDQDGNSDIHRNGLIRLIEGDRAGDEMEARDRIVVRIARAKVEVGFPRDCNFFDDLWPHAREALLEKRGHLKNS